MRPQPTAAGALLVRGSTPASRRVLVLSGTRSARRSPPTRVLGSIMNRLSPMICSSKGENWNATRWVNSNVPSSSVVGPAMRMSEPQPFPVLCPRGMPSRASQVYAGRF